MAAPSNEEALIERLRAQPDDPDTWAIYADLLMQRGEASGELISLQLRLERGSAEPQARARYEALLQAQHQRRFQGDAEVVAAGTWRWGHLRSLSGGDAAWLLERLSEPDARFLHRLVITAINEVALQKVLDAVRSMPLAQLFLMDAQIGDEGARMIAQSDALEGLRELGLAGCGIGVGGVEALASAPRLKRLSRLDLSRNELGMAGVQALMSGARFSGLVALDLRRVGLSNQERAHLNSDHRLRPLRVKL